MLTLYVSILAGVLFLLLFGESSMFDGTPVRTCHYLLTSGSFEALEWAVGKVGGARGLQVYTFIGDACCNRPNPFMQLFYLGLLGGGYYAFGSECFGRIPGPYLSAIHSYTAPLLVLAALWAFAMASFSDPGVITPGNVRRQLSSYPYDGVIYEGETICSTCQIPKPARSKHCSICNRCVARFDHHCGWMNNCVAEKNLRFFLLFLLLHAAVCLYGAYLLVMVLAGELQDRHVMQAIMDQGPKHSLGFRKWFPQVVQWLLVYFSTATMLLLLASMVALLLLAFLGYHIYLAWVNTTTNETFKWMDYKQWRAQEAMAEAETKAKELAKSKLVFGEGESSSAGAKRAKELKEEMTEGSSSGAPSTNLNGTLVNGDSGHKNESSSDFHLDRPKGWWKCWPCSRSKDSKNRVWISPSSIKVHNIYNRGLWENTLEVFWPPGIRPWDEKVERKRGKRKIG